MQKTKKQYPSIWFVALGLVVFVALLIMFFYVRQSVYLWTNVAEVSTSVQSSDHVDVLEEEGLVAAWHFDDGEGQYVSDATRSGFDGEVHGASWTDGVSGSALSFDGKDDYVEFSEPTREALAGLEYGTVALWFKYNRIDPTEILPMFYFGESDGSGASSNFVIEIGHGPFLDTKVYATTYRDTREPILCYDSDQNMDAGTWYHFAYVVNEAGNTGYLNGEELTDRHYNFSDASDTRFFSSLPTTDQFRFGHGWFGIDRRFHWFDGAMDDVRIYDRALNADEIQELVNIAS